MHTFTKRVIPFFLISGLLQACSQKTEDSKSKAATPAPISVTVMEAQSETLPAQLELVGQTESPQDVEVRARISGLLVKQLFKEGAYVKAGQPLFEIEKSNYAITQAQAKAAVTQANASYIQAKREAVRQKELFAKQAVSKKEFEDAQTQEQLTHAALMQAQAALSQAELNLSYTTVKAPSTGITARAARSVGNLITANTADALLTTIVQINPIRARFSVTDNDLAQLSIPALNENALNDIELILPNGTTYAHKGKLNFLASQIDPALGTRTLRAEFSNPEMAVLPGQFVRVRLHSKTPRQVFLVPQVAVSQTDKGFLVFVTGKDKQATPRPVQVAEWIGTNWVITSGLHQGEQVVIDNLIKMRPGVPLAPKLLSKESPKKT
ncbi:MAG: efflux RND transporter periplasmic adaptor subunit [Pseudomonadota bacterium]